MIASPQVDSATTPHSKIGRHREKVLVLLNADGFVECFASKQVDIHVTNVPQASTPAAEIAAQEYVGLTIPRSYRDVYWPSYRRAAELMRTITATDIMRRDADVELLQSIQNKNNDRKENHKIWSL